MALRRSGTWALSFASRAHFSRPVVGSTRFFHTPTASRPTKASLWTKVAPLAVAGVTVAVLTVINISPIDAEAKVDTLGVLAWGYNGRKVVSPTKKDQAIKSPEPIHFFDGLELRDLVLGEEFGVAVTPKGDLLQWGAGYSPTAERPEITLRGRDIRRAVISRGRIYAVNDAGTNVYSLAGTKSKQDLESKSSGWSIFHPFGKSKMTGKQLKVPLKRFEKITQIEAGENHLLLLTSKGRVFTAVTGSLPINTTDGELGVPVLLTGDPEESIAAESVFEVASLSKVHAVQIATGSHHSVIRSNDGRVWVFGSNLYGQLGMDYTVDTAYLPIPVHLALDRLYNVKGLAQLTCDYIAAGGESTYFVTHNLKKNEYDVWASGSGLHGQHGTGRYVHSQGTPVRIRALSSISEYSEKNSNIRQVPIRYISVGRRHAAAVLDNTNDDRRAAVRRQLMVWGANDWFQIGNGRRSNQTKPTSMSDVLADRTYARGAVGEEVYKDDNVQVNESQRQLSEGQSKKGYHVEETIVCGPFSSAIYWKCN
ncbi:regulator of chromosome condensation 1/beta-lactamase-inhibitor protein II [Lipomyces oligophaga]|uniref:regulator of chromosome condensation 1/beta-lactamase-inhibitor protein II n=1 Tax=Lipomyces oligophaga TaxID=45792 RepID=UPI0034CE5E57